VSKIQSTTILIIILLSGLFLGSCQSPAPAPPPPPLKGEVDIILGKSMPLESAVLNETRTISVVLPLAYNKTNQNYPVLYLVDGGPHQDLFPMAGMAALASLSGQYQEFILVGIQSNNRYWELTSESTVAYDLKNIPHNGGAQKFRQFIREELKPFIEGRYRTSGETAIIGESLAGLFIVESFLHAPDTFDHYVAVSPSLWWRDMGLSKEAAGILQSKDFPADKSLFLTIASEGGTMIEGMERLVGALEEHTPEGVDWWYRPMPDEEHHTIYNPAALQALRLIFPVKK